MNRHSFALALLLCAATSFAQKQTFEMKAGARILIDAFDQPKACIYGPLKIMDGAVILRGGSICARGGHGSLHLADFGTGPFLIDDEGYIFHLPMRPMNPQQIVREFVNGVH